MDNGLADKIKSFLATPDAADKIASMAGMLGGGAQPPKQEPEQYQSSESIPTALLQAPIQSGGYSQLISALRPLIRVEKRQKLDSLERAISLATLFSTMKKGKL